MGSEEVRQRRQRKRAGVNSPSTSLPTFGQLRPNVQSYRSILMSPGFLEVSHCVDRVVVPG